MTYWDYIAQSFFSEKYSYSTFESEYFLGNTISDEDKSKWGLLCEDMKGLDECHFPRYIGLEQGRKMNLDYQLLVSCDAFKYAYAAAVYLFQEITTVQRIDLISQN